MSNIEVNQRLFHGHKNSVVYTNISTHISDATQNNPKENSSKISRKERCRSVASIRPLSSSQSPVLNSESINNKDVSKIGLKNKMNMESSLVYKHTKEAYKYLLNRMKAQIKRYPSSHQFETTSHYQSVVKSHTCSEELDSIKDIAKSKIANKSKRKIVRPQSHYIRGSNPNREDRTRKMLTADRKSIESAERTLIRANKSAASLDTSSWLNTHSITDLSKPITSQNMFNCKIQNITHVEKHNYNVNFNPLPSTIQDGDQNVSLQKMNRIDRK